MAFRVHGLSKHFGFEGLGGLCLYQRGQGELESQLLLLTIFAIVANSNFVM